MPTPVQFVKSVEWLVVVALEEERSEVVRRAALTLKESSTTDQSFRVEATEPDANGHSRAGLYCLGSMGNEVALQRSRALIDLLSPQTVLSIGISGALDDEVAVGDVVVARTTENWAHNAKYSSDEYGKLTLQFSGDTYRTSNDMLDQCLSFVRSREAIDSWQTTSLRRLSDLGLSTDHETEETQPRPAIRDGDIAAGPSVVAAKEFRRALKGHNRKFLCVDMESAGVARAVFETEKSCRLLILRGISDPADESKVTLEKESKCRLRQWSLWNAIDLVNRVFWETPLGQEDIRGRLRALAEREYLPAAYETKNAVAQISRETVAAFFTAVSSRNTHQIDLVEAAVDSILSSPKELALRVFGAQGTGKSSFLALLYWRLLERVTDDPEMLVAYVNLQRYHTGEHNLRSPSSTIKPRDALDEHLRVFEDIRAQYADFQLVVIVDGFDPNGPGDEAIEEALLDALEGIANKRVVGIKDPKDDATTQWGSPFFSLGFRAVALEDPRAKACAEAFATMSRLGVTAPDLLKRAEKCRLKVIDAFTLYLLSTTQPSERQGHDLVGLIEEFISNWIARATRSVGAREHLINRAAHLAFQYEVEDDTRSREVSDDQIAWGLVRLHAQVANYLAARYIVSEFRRFRHPHKPIRKHEQGYVYPYRINRFCKAILQRNDRTQRDVLTGIRRVLRSRKAHAYAKAQASYLAGRVKGGQNRANAIKILTDFLENLRTQEEKIPTDHGEKVDRAVWRTVYISLAYLGDRDREDEYVRHLLSRPEWDLFNRGFHLEYYGDQRYSPSEALVSDDELRPCPRTMEQLSGRLVGRPNNPLRNVELQTLLSLAQHRHARGLLNEDDRSMVLGIARQELSSGRAIAEPLRNFISMVAMHLKAPEFYAHGVFEEAYGIKSEPRVGWVNRGLANRETVAAHMYGAFLIGLFLLPSHGTMDEPYDKNRVLRMLLIHDLAEARFGDKLPSQKSEATKADERAYFESLRFSGTYEPLADLKEVYELWVEFDSCATIDARVAKDIDKLENLAQLRQYTAHGDEIDDMEEWEQGLLTQVRTNVVQRVAEQLPQIWRWMPRH